MIKQLLALVFFSIAIIFFMTYAHQGVQYLLNIHEWVSQSLTNVFSGGEAGNMTRNLIALLSVPFLISLIPTLIYWTIKRHWFPYFIEIVWVVWLIQIGALIMMFKAVV